MSKIENDNWIPYKGFSEPTIEKNEDKLTISWQPKTYDELDAFCLFHYKKPFHSLGISYEVAVKNILKLQIEYMEKTIENLSIEMDTKDE